MWAASFKASLQIFLYSGRTLNLNVKRSNSVNLTATGRSDVHCELCSEALSQHSQYVKVKTHQQFAEKAAEPAAAATIDSEALFGGSWKPENTSDTETLSTAAPSPSPHHRESSGSEREAGGRKTSQCCLSHCGKWKCRDRMVNNKQNWHWNNDKKTSYTDQWSW